MIREDETSISVREDVKIQKYDLDGKLIETIYTTDGQITNIERGEEE
jgi:hypothetical protein